MAFRPYFLRVLSSFPCLPFFFFLLPSLTIPTSPWLMHCLTGKGASRMRRSLLLPYSALFFCSANQIEWGGREKEGDSLDFTHSLDRSGGERVCEMKWAFNWRRILFIPRELPCNIMLIDPSWWRDSGDSRGMNRKNEGFKNAGIPRSNGFQYTLTWVTHV